MFPFDLDDEELEESEEIEAVVPADYEIDFSTGKLTGRIINGVDAVRQWVNIVLHTARYRYPQYSWAHGCELDDLIGKGYDTETATSLARQMVESALLVSDDIEDIDNFECSIADDKLTCSFHIDTIYGGAEVNV